MRSGLRGEEMPKESKVRSICFAALFHVLIYQPILAQIHVYLSSDTLASTSVSQVLLPYPLPFPSNLIHPSLFTDVGPPNVLY